MEKILKKLQNCWKNPYDLVSGLHQKESGLVPECTNHANAQRGYTAGRIIRLSLRHADRSKIGRFTGSACSGTR